jgi:hypothetical protein
MVSKTLILLVAVFNRLAATVLVCHMDGQSLRIGAVRGENTLNHEERLTMTHVLAVNKAAAALSAGQIVHSVKQVCLSHAVIPHKTVYTAAEVKIGLGDVLIVQY